MNTIIPMEPKSSGSIPERGEWLAQIKWDGVRIQTYYDGKKVLLFNRKANERTSQYPELINIESYCTASSVILDGEVIALGEDGKPSFHEVMRRDGIRRIERVEQMMKVVPITYMIFDVLFWNGEWVIHLPLTDRQEILASIINPGDHVQLVSSHEDADILLKVMKQQGMEGIVLKRKNSPYLIGEKKDQWLKVKNFSDLIAVVGGYTVRDGIANALLLGLYDEHGKLWYIGHSGTGKLTKQEWRDLTEQLSMIEQSHQPFVNTPQRSAAAKWVQPLITVKILYAEWTPGGSLRQPSIQGLVEYPPEDCLLEV
jgi:bifunctional non-homologous end joining protein LigD